MSKRMKSTCPLPPGAHLRRCGKTQLGRPLTDNVRLLVCRYKENLQNNSKFHCTSGDGGGGDGGGDGGGNQDPDPGAAAAGTDEATTATLPAGGLGAGGVSVGVDAAGGVGGPGLPGCPMKWPCNKPAGVRELLGERALTLCALRVRLAASRLCRGACESLFLCKNLPTHGALLAALSLSQPCQSSPDSDSCC